MARGMMSMQLGALIKALNAFPPTALVEFDAKKYGHVDPEPCSYRGFYEDLATAKAETKRLTNIRRNRKR